eukprot:s2640_g3.t1
MAAVPIYPPETCLQVHFPVGGDHTVNDLFPALGLNDVHCEVGDFIFPAMLPANRQSLPLVYDIAPSWVPWAENLQTEKRLWFIFVHPQPLFTILQYLAVNLPGLEIDLCPTDLPDDQRSTMVLHLIAFPGPDLLDGVHRLHDRANRMHGRVQTLEHQVRRLQGQVQQLLQQQQQAARSMGGSLSIHSDDGAGDESASEPAALVRGKSPATLSRRLSQISRYIRWATNDAKRLPFPVTGELVKNYVRHLRNEGSAHTAFKGFAEVLKFMKHVVGLDCDLTAFDSAWVSGVIRSAQQSRPLRKQSTTLNVKTLQYLEIFLCSQEHSIVDRFAAGVFLFATYSRTRFGDLRRIAKIIIDPATDESEGSLGYIEMHSASHKMRATGNRLGAHLPLIAPIKGLGERAWGKDFVDVAKRAGLDMGEWTSGAPLLPAPTQVGDWTDRSVTSAEIGKWLLGILAHCKDFDPVGFTRHGCKATTLVMLSRYGASSDDRLILGHHQVHKGALEVYARDLQSAPLRVLEKMFGDIRCGRFSPDLTRSGMFSTLVTTSLHPLQAVGDVSPAPTTGKDA